MGSYAGGAMDAEKLRDEEPEEEFQSQSQNEDGTEPIGARIVWIPSQAEAVSAIPRPVDDLREDVPPPDPMRMVDMQRQQEAMAKLADLVKPPAMAPPVLQQAPPAPVNSGRANMPPGTRAGAGSGDANTARSTANAPAGTTADAASRPAIQTGGTPTVAAGAAKPGTSGTPKPGTPGTAGLGTQGSRPQGKAAATGTKQQNSSGQHTQTDKGGWIERGKDFIGQAEKRARDAEDTVLSWFHRLMATKDGDAKTTSGGAAAGAGNSGQGSASQPAELPKRGSDNHGEINHEVSNRKPAKEAASSEGGNNIYKPPEGQRVQDVVKEGYMPDGNKEAQCVQLVKVLVGAPSTTQWKPGQKVTRGAKIPPGTVIATFVDGRYPQGHLTRPKGQEGPYSDRHAAIYLGQTKEGIWVMDQDNQRKAIHTTLIPWDRPGKGNGNNGSAFSVIEWDTSKGKTARR